MKRRNIKSRLHHLIWRSDLEMTRFGLALGSILCALLLAWPGDLFQARPDDYRLMAGIASEWTWAALFFLQGSVMLYSLLVGYRSNLSFLSDALLGCLLWSSLTVASFVAHYESLTTYQPPAELAFVAVGAAMSWWCFVRYSVSTGEEGCHCDQ